MPQPTLNTASGVDAPARPGDKTGHRRPRKGIPACRTCKEKRTACIGDPPQCLTCDRTGRACDWPIIARPRDAAVRGLPLLLPAHPGPQDDEPSWLASQDIHHHPKDPFPEPLDTDLTSIPDADVLPSPTANLILFSTAFFSNLALQLTSLDYEALDRLKEEAVFGNSGTKEPEWSTHAITLKHLGQNPVMLRFMLAATLNEFSWRAGMDATKSMDMLQRANQHYVEAKKMLMCLVSSADEEPDHLLAVASFWFWYLRHRRDFDQDRLAYAELTGYMTFYYFQHSIVRLLSCMPELDPRMACVARLTIWLFWADVAACFQGHGGDFARLLTESSPEALSRIYDRSRKALMSNFPSYPPQQVKDDNDNGPSLELLHHAWVLVQTINNLLDSGAKLGPVQSAELGSHIKGLFERYANVVALAKSPDSSRGRQLGNADWAVANLHALCIYLSRCTIVVQGQATPLPVEVNGAAGDTAGLIEIMDRSMDGGPAGQVDRFQWSIFWAGIGTCYRIERKWVQQKLTSPGLGSAFRLVQQEQNAAGCPIGIDRIRSICRESCGVSPTFVPDILFI